MDIRNMRQLLAVRDHGSLAKAAHALGMSQPSLSSAMLRLEDQLHVKLFDRTAHGSQLTAIGELIADRASKVITETEQIVRDAALVAGGEAGAVQVGISTALTEHFLPRFVCGLAERYPALSLCVDVLDGDRLIPLVKSRELDLAICALADAVDDEALVATEVLTSDGVAVARPDHPLALEPHVSRTRFAEFPSAGATTKRFTNAAVLGVPEDPHTILKYRSNSYDTLLLLALGGHATLVAPSFVVRPHLESGRLARIDLDWSFRVTFAAIATRAASYSPVVSRIIGQAVAIGAILQSES